MLLRHTNPSDALYSVAAFAGNAGHLSCLESACAGGGRDRQAGSRCAVSCHLPGLRCHAHLDIQRPALHAAGIVRAGHQRG